MFPCSSCHRHLRETEAVCPFCGTTQRSTSSTRDHVGAFAISLLLLGTSACSSDPVGETSTTTSSSTTTDSTTTSSTETSSGATETDTGDMTNTSNTSNTSGSFYAGPDVDFGGVLECDPFAQDCPEGEKCVPNASTGGDWDSNTCVVVTGAQAAGEPCVRTGILDASDDCGVDSLCWNVDDQGMGVCLPFCTGTPDDPICADATACSIQFEGSVNVCLDSCNPIMQDCPPEQGCYFDNFNFVCTTTSQDIPEGEPCGYVNDCGLGLTCLEVVDFAIDCAGAACCTAFCDLMDPNACPDPNFECVTFFENAQPPPGLENVGVCLPIPP